MIVRDVYPPRWKAMALWVGLWILVTSRSLVLAGGSIAYTVEITPTGTEALDQALTETSDLVRLRETGAVGPFGLIIRAREDAQRLGKALGGLGHYAATLSIAVAGKELDDPALADWLEQRPAEPPVPVKIVATPGPLFHLGKVELRGAVPERARTELRLAPGAPAVAADVLAARERLLAALREDGFALARVDPPVAILRPQAEKLDITLPVETGPRVNLGPIGIKGLDRMNEAFVRRRLQLKPGEQFAPSRIEAARQDLLGLGVFSSVRIAPPEEAGAGTGLRNGTLPIEVAVTERKLHVVNLSAAWSTDLGGGATASWQHRNLLGNAEQLKLSAGINNLGGTAARAPGYNASIQFIKPDFGARDQSLQIDLSALRQELEAYTQTAVIAGVQLNRKFSLHWSGSAGVGFELEQVLQNGVTRDYSLIDLPFKIRYDSSDNLLNPARGLRGSLSVTPTWSMADGTFFLVTQVAGSTYVDFGTNGRSVLAVRGLFGSAVGASTLDLPPDRRLYAGGSATVRGYRFQSIGPQFANGKPIGGTSVAAVGIEFRQRFLEDWGAVVFIDAGQVGSDITPFAETPRVGAGIGARYYTSFGPIRVDVGVPLNPPPGADAFGIYVGIGQAF